MTAWLAEWLKTVIAVVLLAGLVDLLLPGRAMQRYSRLVVGLLVLLTLLAPVLKLFGADPGRLLNEGLQRLETAADPGMPDMPALSQIRSDAERLQAGQERQARSLAAGRLSAAMAEAVRVETGLVPEDIEIKLSSNAGREGELPSVTVRLRPGGTAAAGEAGGGAAAPETMNGGESADAGQSAGADAPPAAPVEEVWIDIAPVTGGGAPGNAAAAQGGGAADDWKPAGQAAAEAVRAVLSRGWGIPPERVDVWEPAQTTAPDGG